MSVNTGPQMVRSAMEPQVQRLFSYVFGSRAKPSDTQLASRRVRLSVDHLEHRLLLDGGGVLAAVGLPNGPAVLAPDTQAVAAAGGLDGVVGQIPNDGIG